MPTRCKNCSAVRSLGSPSTATLLRLALDGSDVECVEQLGIRRHLVIQRALRLADDPAVALEYAQRTNDPRPDDWAGVVAWWGLSD